MITKNNTFGAPESSVTFMIADDGNNSMLYSKANVKYGVDVNITPLKNRYFRYTINQIDNEPNYGVLDGASLQIAHGVVRLNLDNSVTFPSNKGLNLDVPFGSKGINGIKKGWKLIRLNLPKLARTQSNRSELLKKRNVLRKKLHRVDRKLSLTSKPHNYSNYSRE